MSVDTYIQLGMLVLTFATVAGGVAGWIITRRRRLRGTQLQLAAFGRHAPFIYSVMISEAASRVSGVAMWTRLHIYNTSDEPLLISELRAYEEGATPRPIIDFPVRELNSMQREHSPKRPVEMPLTIDGGTGVELFFLSQVSVPPKVGEVLFRLYGGTVREHSAYSHVLNRMIKDRDALNKHMSNPKIAATMGIIVRDAKIVEADLKHRLLLKEDGAVTFAPQFGTLDGDVALDTRFELLPQERSGPSPVSIAASQFHIEAVTAAGRVLRRSIDTDKDAFWFVHRHIG